ncbi:hypothetical protein [Clostridium sp. C8]|uniref:Uncharacterized protein n=1 Tax=bioreactor metagenome TaxID=1076179 RepID=A0A645JD16_9ZZZZ|nr:hypothetical protein [Clostridium sp. C8]
MKKKLLIELFVYVIIVVIGIVLLFTYKPQREPITLPSDFKITQGSERNASLPIK